MKIEFVPSQSSRGLLYVRKNGRFVGSISTGLWNPGKYFVEDDRQSGELRYAAYKADCRYIGTYKSLAKAKAAALRAFNKPPKWREDSRRWKAR